MGDAAVFGDAGEPTAGQLEITPADPVVTVTAAEPNPELQLELRRAGRKISASRWTVLEPDVATIDDDGLLVATGNVARETRIEAFVGEERAGTTVTVQIEAQQTGAEDDGSGTSSGGYGGVGGEGPGGEVDDDLRDLLLSDPTEDASLQWLYPYDKTGEHARLLGVDPCKEDGASCESGVECCTGRCQEDFDTGERTCGLKTPACAEEYDRCEKSADCCDRSLICLGNICTQPKPPE